MKFSLKDYQDDAVREVLGNLAKARKRWRLEGERNAFSLSAATGAGKTVMAAAVFEALFHGDDAYAFEPDPGAVVIWFSDDPSLNEQTRFRLMQAADRLNDLVVVEHPFSREKLEPGKIYFLNTQKLGRNSRLVRGDPEGDRGLFADIRPDDQAYTLWDTIRNTIEDKRLTLYLALDEAHRGMGTTTTAAQNERSTIVKRLINGAGTAPGIPVVWGISATIDRFTKAMDGAKGRIMLPNVVVEPAKVQDSGLLKDTILLDIPKDGAQSDTVLVRRATEKIKATDEAWAEYAKQQGHETQVKPLMVLQVPNKPDPHDVGRWLDTVFEHWTGLPRDSVAHVLGEHAMQSFGGHQVPHIPPERVQDSPWVRVLIAKEAISTGWDCPRAEVMVSFRPAADRTYIMQLLGRMVRTPLARRIPGNERLNAVDCILPKFDKESAEGVAKALMQGGSGEDALLAGARALINASEMTPNPAVPEAVWERLLALPSQSLPQKGARPVKRLTWLAGELAYDGLLPDAGQKAHADMHKVLDAAGKRYADEIEKARKIVLTVEGDTVKIDMRGKALTFDDFIEAADMAVIDDFYRRAGRALHPDLIKTYVEHLAAEGRDDSDDEETDEIEALMDARAEVAALGLVTEVSLYLDAEADKLAKMWLEKYRVQIKNLSDDRQEDYRLIRAMSREPQSVDLVRPQSRMEPTAERSEDGTETPIPTWSLHLLCGADGKFPAKLNELEKEVLKTEMGRDGFLAWYRNPSTASQDSLGIAYEVESDFKMVRPDFIFFSRRKDGSVAADIVDPHGTQWADALPKLKGLADYAEVHASAFRRIESVDKVGGKFRVLDLTDAETRKAIRTASDARSLFEGQAASDLI